MSAVETPIEAPLDAPKRPAVRPPTGLGKATVIVLWIYGATLALELLSQVVAMQQLSALAPDTAANLFDLSTTLGDLGAALSLPFLLRLAVMIGTIILVAVWIYQVNAAAKKLAKNKEVSPAWAVGWYFIPIANLWKPFQAMDETWKISTEPMRWKGQDTPGLLRFWWGLWLGGSFVGNLLFRLGGSATTAGNVLELRVVWGLYDVMLIAGVVCLIQIVREITKRQAAAVRRNVFD